MLLFFNISGGELVLIVIVIYLIFGPKKIPELARMVGKGINELRPATDDIKNEFNREVNKVKQDIHVEDPFVKKEAEPAKKTSEKRDPAPKTPSEKKEPPSSEEDKVDR